MPAADFLDRVRQRLAATSSSPTAHPGSYPAPVRTLPDDLLAEFTAQLTAVGGHVYTAADAVAARLHCRDIITSLRQRGRKMDRAALSGHTLLTEMALAGLLTRMGIAAGLFTGAADEPFPLETAVVGLTGVEYAVASSGTLAVAAAPHHPRAVSLLPPVHIALVRRAQLLPDLAALMRRIQTDAASPPSGLALITGPSRTADIEQTLSIGVHGPAEVHVIFL